jgi:hypothetical protein
VRGVFTGEFVPDADAPSNLVDRLTRMREWAEKSVGVEKWGVSEKERADARLAAMGQSDNPERVMKGVVVVVRQLQNKALVDTVIAQVLNGKGK